MVTGLGIVPVKVGMATPLFNHWSKSGKGSQILRNNLGFFVFIFINTEIFFQLMMMNIVVAPESILCQFLPRTLGYFPSSWSAQDPHGPHPDLGAHISSSCLCSSNTKDNNILLIHLFLSVHLSI